MSIPNISEFTIRRHANAKSFQRGEAYYEAGAVITVTQRGRLLQAEVAGSQAKPYRVNLSVDGEGLIKANCTCAYDFNGWCKHVVATMLVLARQSEAVEQRPTLEQLLNCLDMIQTQRLLQELVAEYPPLIEVIDRHVCLITNPAAKPKATKSARQSTIDPAPFRRQVRQILHDAVRYLEEGYEEDPITEEVLNLVQAAVDFSERGESENAIAILEAITSTCAENWDDVAEYGAENDDLVCELNNAWCEAILTAELSPEEKVDVQVNLEAWQDEWNADFTMSLEALQQGWDYPPLVKVLAGNISETRIWQEEAPDYADDLALIRLKILERQERYQEYLYLAQAEEQTQYYLTMLGRLGRVEDAIDAAQSQMKSMEEAFALAKTLREQGALQQALHIAQLGLKLPGNCQYDLGSWTSHLAEGLGDDTATLQAIEAAFRASPSLADYQKIEELAGDNWESWKTSLLRIIRAHSVWGTESAKVDIFLYEGLIDDAIAVVNQLSSYHSELIHRVMNAAIIHNPGWVIANACRRAEKIMNAGKAEYYDLAVEWVKKARAAYLESGRKVEWLSYRDNLMQTHARKRKLMGMFKQVGME
ncbi:SWIM zinc finger family protein [Nostoc sp. UHCC 0302]|uniref:SWIM zinc finger family protein n=1 Tax=Nostoc sp. UHCC 0302 TaxID=3134896 RepID=UPI00311CA1F6